MRRIFIGGTLACFLSFVFPYRGCCQDSVLLSLMDRGMENLSGGGDTIRRWYSFEDRVHRNTYSGLKEAVDILIDDPSVQGDTEFILLSNGVPQVRASIPSSLLYSFRKGEISKKDVYRRMDISVDTDHYRRDDKNVRVYRRSAGKLDLILYPQFELSNYRLDVLYEVVLNLAPALEIPLWKGGRLIGQVIFPLYNNLAGEVDYIRPGILAASQSFRLYDNVQGIVSVGNFTASRMGIDFRMGYTASGGRWGIEGNVGITGSSTFYGGKWEVSNWNRTSFFVSSFYFEPRYQLSFCLTGGQYIYGDRGGRLDITRHWGEVSVGVFGMYSGGTANGGFHLAIPLPGRTRRRSRSFPLRVMAPEYFDWEYSAQTTPDYQSRRLGRYYETRPDANRSRRFFNPSYIRHNLIGGWNRAYFEK